MSAGNSASYPQGFNSKYLFQSFSGLKCGSKSQKLHWSIVLVGPVVSHQEDSELTSPTGFLHSGQSFIFISSLSSLLGVKLSQGYPPYHTQTSKPYPLYLLPLTSAISTVSSWPPTDFLVNLVNFAITSDACSLLACVFGRYFSGL